MKIKIWNTFSDLQLVLCIIYDICYISGRIDGLKVWIRNCEQVALLRWLLVEHKKLQLKIWLKFWKKHNEKLQKKGPNCRIIFNHNFSSLFFTGWILIVIKAKIADIISSLKMLNDWNPFVSINLPQNNFALIHWTDLIT